MTQQVKIKCLSIENTEYKDRYSNELSIEIDKFNQDCIIIAVEGVNDATEIKLDKRQVSLLCLNLQELRYEMK
jgi:hypothetical protein